MTSGTRAGRGTRRRWVRVTDKTSSVPLSISQANRLGTKIRREFRATNTLTDAHREQLEEYVKPFIATMRAVEAKLSGLGFDPRPRLKNLSTIAEKLVRESSRLATVEDIAGVRVVIDGTRRDQDRVVDLIVNAFPGSSRRDRRADPSYGYRAVHVIVHADGCVCEVQVRTRRQHQWAEISERLGDSWGRQIRYGGEPDDADRPAFELDDDSDPPDIREITRSSILGLVRDLAERIDSVEKFDADFEPDTERVLWQAMNDPELTEEQRADVAAAFSSFKKAEEQMGTMAQTIDSHLKLLERFADQV
jgi:hypothetical protein